MADIIIPYNELVSRYGKDTADRIVQYLADGYSPLLLRELDPWTGRIHWEYQMPQPTGNVNIWQVPINENGEAQFDKAIWVGPDPPPGDRPTPTEFLQGKRNDAPDGQVAIEMPNNMLVVQGQTIDAGQTSPYSEQPVSTTPKTPLNTNGTASNAVDSGRQANQTGVQPMIEPLDDLIIRRAGGNGNYSWDQWNWFFEQVTGKPGPAPEDRGYQRSSDGLVYINGQAYFDFYTWKAHAFPQGFGDIQPVPPGKKTPSTPVSPGIPPTHKNLLEKLLDFLKMILRMIIAGGK
jgi:hypothetical protein